MEMMTVPSKFRWMNFDIEELNHLPLTKKKVLYKENEMNIRQCLGEAVPTEIMRQLARNIKECLSRKRCESIEINKIIVDNALLNRENLKEFLKSNPLDLDIASLMRITELCNARRVENSAFTPISLL